MSTQVVTAANFEATIAKGIVFVDFWATWCGPCRTFGPVFEAASEKHTDITWAKVDTDAEQAIAGTFGIRSIPTLMIFRDGIPLFQEAGALPGAALDQLADQVKALDMEEVRKKMAEHAASHEHGPNCNHDHDHDHAHGDAHGHDHGPGGGHHHH